MRYLTPETPPSDNATHFPFSIFHFALFILRDRVTGEMHPLWLRPAALGSSVAITPMDVIATNERKERKQKWNGREFKRSLGVFSRLSRDSRHGPFMKRNKQPSIRPCASTPPESARDPPSSSPARSNHIPRPCRSVAQHPGTAATFRPTSAFRPNPTPAPTVPAPPRTNPASLRQSRRSLGRGGTPISLDKPG